MKTIGIIGSRRRNELQDFEDTLHAYLIVSDQNYILQIVSGGCPKGGDHFAEVIAKATDTRIRIHYPDKSKLDPELMKKNPRAAYAVINYARNKLIAADSDIIIACVAPDRKGGTEDTLKHFRKRFDKTEKDLIKEGRIVLV